MRTSGGMAYAAMPCAAAPEALGTARSLLREGRLLEAATTLSGITEGDLGSATDRATHQALRIELLLARGELGPAMTAGEALTPLLDHTSYAGAQARHARGELAAALGELDTALEHYLRVGELAATETPGGEPLPWRCGAAIVLLHQGQTAEAARLAREQVAQLAAMQDLADDPSHHPGHDLGYDPAYGRALALRMLATADVGVDRLATLRTARAALTGTRADRLAAQIDTDLAGLLMLSSGFGQAEIAEAVELLRAAEHYAGRQELRPLQGRVRRLLERLGQEPRPVQSEALSALTPGETRVARLAADGLSNREIAARLVITVKAVEWHLSHVYRKLGIRSRHRLAGTLGVPA